LEEMKRTMAVDWENPHVVSKNKRGSHTPLRSHPDAHAGLQYWRSAARGPPIESTNRILSLNGEWAFKLFLRPEDVPDSQLKQREIADIDTWGQVGKVVEHTHPAINA
jgi:beta-galactosidase